jgi:hypothetical protein
MSPEALPNSAKAQVDDETAKGIKNRVKELAGGDQSGDVMVLNIPWKIEKLGFSPNDLVIDKIGQLQEARIAGAFGIPPVTVGLLVGLQNASAKASHKESKLQAYESGIMPIQRDLCETLDSRLIPELGDETKEITAFDTREVAALKENQNDIAKRADDGFKAGTVKQNEARAARGLPADENGDAYSYELLPAPGALLGGLTGKPGEDPTDEAQAGTLATTTLNGIQIQAALDVIERLQLNQITEMIAVELLVAVGIERTRAEEMASSAQDAEAPAEKVEEEPTDEDEDLTPAERAAAKSLKLKIGDYWRKRAARRKR